MALDANQTSCDECRPWTEEFASLSSLYTMQNLAGGDGSALAQLQRRLDAAERKLTDHTCATQGIEFREPGPALS